MTPLRQRMIEDMQLRGLAPQTQRGYVLHVAAFARYFGKSPAVLDQEAIRQYLLYLLNEKKMSPEGINQQVSALKFLYLTTLEMPWSDVDFPRVKRPHKLPVVLSQEELVHFFDHIPGIKYRAALMVCYGAGLRISEAVALRVRDIDSSRMLLRVENGKGGKDRYTLLSPRLLQLLRLYWRMSHPRPSKPQDAETIGDQYLFPSWREGKHITEGTLRTACREVWLRSGLRKKVTVHTLRHCFASHLLENGADIRVIQVLLGHTRIDTTAHYTAVSPRVVGRTQSPLDVLMPQAPSKPVPKVKPKKK
ncbi:MAG: site-specific integrase [Bryobacterales bacterium]|nr:site-specific integrase [Bryobacterales bacterium]